jgi:hypothetical protein
VKIMGAQERDFSSFYLGDNVYELAGGVVPEIARRLDVPLGEEPNSADLQAIMTQVGTNKVLRENAEVTAIDRQSMTELVEVSGIQKPLNRSLVTPELSVRHKSVDALVMLGGVANWMERGGIAVPSYLVDTPIYAVGGTRVMDTATEIENGRVKYWHTTRKEYPTEAEFMKQIIAPRLRRLGHKVITQNDGEYQTKNGDEILDELIERHPDLVDQRLAMVRVANAGVAMAIQMRDAVRRQNSTFDVASESPQTFVITDTFPVARHETEDKDPRHFQKAATALRQVVLTAKKLHEAAGGE